MRTTKVVDWLRKLGRSASILAVGAAFLAGPALAQSAAPAPQESAMVKLIRLLAKQGSISQEAADALVEQAEAEAQSHAAPANVAAAPAPGAPTAPAEAAANAPPPGPGVLRVPYVPEFVKNQIRDEVKGELVAQAKAEGWAPPGGVPEWVNRIEWMGDVRVRDEFDLYPNGNTNQFIDYYTFNLNGPVDINDITNPNGLPFLNTTQNRNNYLSIRARVGLKATVSDSVTAVFRLATGNDNQPVSTTQALGADFTKKSAWLDEVYFDIHPVDWASGEIGRMPNPFIHTEMMWDENVQFDGAMARLTPHVAFDGVTPFATGGAFPIGYMPASFPTYATQKSPDQTKWLFAGQAGALWKNDEFWARLSGTYWDYNDVRGQVSDPCLIYTGIKQCSSDNTRPAYMQKGNTLFLLRNIVPDPSSPLNYAQPQFVGLAYNYRLGDVIGEFDAKLWGDHHLLLTGEYVHNFAYDPAKAFAQAPGFQPVTNQNGSSGLASYQSGPNAWTFRATVGDPGPLHARGSWNLTAGYKYIEPDALLDAFNDQNFHLGGTNAKGYFVIASYALFNNTWLSGRWFSANQVYGPPLAIDVLQIDLNASF